MKEVATLQCQLRQLIFAAYDEVTVAILDRLAEGKRPSRLHRFPRFSLRDNGMPSLDDGAWSGDTKAQRGDDTKRRSGRYTGRNHRARNFAGRW